MQNYQCCASKIPRHLGDASFIQNYKKKDFSGKIVDNDLVPEECMETVRAPCLPSLAHGNQEEVLFLSFFLLFFVSYFLLSFKSLSLSQSQSLSLSESQESRDPLEKGRQGEQQMSLRPFPHVVLFLEL